MVCRVSLDRRTATSFPFVSRTMNSLSREKALPVSTSARPFPCLGFAGSCNAGVK